ncbi:hypothetical protein [Aeribacillus sp. FSL M8-0235]|uniref:hypothetical protein n=1 Tax=Aeribacillus sp. FSL M8-0235 TaxID=2954576 RepID=UPI0030F6A763
MSFLTDMLSKLPDMFKKTPDSTIGKLFTIVSDQIDDLQETLDKMELWRDIDEAEGVVLDRIGVEILQEPRGGISDEEYRLKLKTRIIVNYLSDGDIETIIKLLEVYLGDHLVSVQSGFEVKDGPFAWAPATLFITIKGKDDPISIPFEQLNKVITGGVGTHWEYINERLLSITSGYNKILYPFEYFAGWMISAEEKQTNDNVDSVNSFQFGQIQSSTIQDVYPICGVYEPYNDNITHANEYDLSELYFSLTQDAYPICGTFVAGEVV